jgi:hypothetical protein
VKGGGGHAAFVHAWDSVPGLSTDAEAGGADADADAQPASPALLGLAPGVDVCVPDAPTSEQVLVSTLHQHCVRAGGGRRPGSTQQAGDSVPGRAGWMDS